MIVSIGVNRIRKVVVERLMADNSVGQLFIRYASTFPHCSMKSGEYLWPKTKRLVKDERRSKSKLRVCA